MTSSAAITWRMIEAFRAVMHSGSMTGGARLLHVSQPSVSRLVRDLESILRLKLFERRGTKLLSTDDARALHDEVEESFAGLDRISQAAGRIRDRRLGRLRIAAMPVFAHGVLPDAIATLSRDMPGIFVDIRIVASSNAHELLRSGLVDIAFALIDGDVEPVRRFRGRCSCLLPSGHPLAKYKSIRPVMLKDQPFISLAAASLTRMEVDASFVNAGIERRNIIMETSQSLLASELVMHGLGVAIADPFAARHHEKLGGIIRPYWPPIQFEIGCYVSRPHSNSGLTAKLLSHL